MMLRTTLIALGLAIAPALPALANSPDPSGVWLRDDGNARVRIAPCGSNICATNVWIKDTSGGEEVGDGVVDQLRRVRHAVQASRVVDRRARGQQAGL